MSKEHMSGDATGYKRGAKGIDGEGKPLAKYESQRFGHHWGVVPGDRPGNVVKSQSLPKRHDSSKKSSRNVGIDGPISPKGNELPKFKKFKDWS